MEINMKPITKLSHTSISTYKECPRKYKYHYIDRIRPSKAKSALLFGTAIDQGLNELLLTRDLQKSKEVFLKFWTSQTINNQSVYLETSDLIRYSKKDSDLDVNPWKSLYIKGELILEEYHRTFLPKIKRLISIQDEKYLFNDDGDRITVKLDFIAELTDGKVYIMDNKTTSVKYTADSAKESEQLHLYYAVYDNKVDGVGYFILNKNVRQTKVMHCQSCQIEYDSNRLKKCLECEKILNHVETKYSVDTQCVLNNEINQDTIDKVIQSFDDGNQGISNQEFDMNRKSCMGKFGRCDYFDLCHGKSMEGLIELEKKT